MRILIALTVLQIAAIGFLAARIVALERVAREESTVAPAPSAPPAEVSQRQVVAVPEARPPAAYPDAGEIRRIVRQELAAQLGGFGVTESDDAIAAEPDPALEAERQHQLAWVDQEIDRYVGVGRITDLEMANLQLEIAKLDQEGRRKTLGRLVRALNTGELEGRL